MPPVYENGVLKMTMAEWKKIHRDFKGILNKQRTALYFVPGQGTSLVPVQIVKSSPEV